MLVVYIREFLQNICHLFRELLVSLLISRLVLLLGLSRWWLNRDLGGLVCGLIFLGFLRFLGEVHVAFQDFGFLHFTAALFSHFFKLDLEYKIKNKTLKNGLLNV